MGKTKNVGIRLTIWVVLALAGLLTGLAWALSSPTGSSPDDDYHQTSIWCPPPVEGGSCPRVVQPDGKVAVEVPKLVTTVCYAFDKNQSAACQEKFDHMAGVLTPRYDRGEYPGPYYHIMHLFAGADPISSIVWIRVVNVLLAVMLLGAVVAIAPVHTRRLMVLAGLSTMVPLGVFIIASINPSSWAVVGLTACWLALHVHFQATARWRAITSAALAVAGGVIAAVSRADAGAYLIVLVGVFGFLHLPSLRERKMRLLAPAIIVLIGLISFLRSGQSAVLASGFAPLTDRHPTALLLSNLTELPGLLVGSFGLKWGLGWLDTLMPAVVGVSVLIVVSFLVMTGLSQLWLRKALALATLGTVLIVLPLWLLQQSQAVVGEQVQARYLLPLIPALVALALVGRRPRLTIGITGGQTAVVYVLLVIAQSAALHSNIRRYVTGQDVWHIDLNRATEWWWSTGPAPMTVWLLGSVAFAVLALSLFVVRDRNPQPRLRARQR